MPTLEEMKANRKLWVEALRSGKYKQTRQGWLRVEDHFCCLGVLADVAGCEWSGDILGKADEQWRYAPKRAMEFVGLRSTGELMAMNDREMRRFKTIAKYIESEPFGLFVESVQS